MGNRNCRSAAAAYGLALVLAALPAAAVEPSSTILLRLDGRHVKWGAPAYGEPAQVTYALLQGPLERPAARNCRSMRELDGLLRTNAMAPAAFADEVRAAFAIWSNAADLRFVEVADPARADLVLGAQSGSDGAAFTDVTAARAGPGPVKPLTAAAICLDPTVRWELAVDRDPRTYNVRYVLAHEIGHAIGLDHAGRARGLMGFAYLERLASATEVRLGPVDIAAVTALYGPPRPVVADGSAQTPAPE